MSPTLRMLGLPALAFAGTWVAHSLLGLAFFPGSSLTTLLFHPSAYDLVLRILLGGLVAGGVFVFQASSRPRQSVNEDLYQSLVESSPQCFIVHRDFNIQYVNQYSLGFFNLPELGDYAGTPIFNFIPADHHDRVRQISNMVLAGEQAPSSELQVQQLDGTVVDIRSTSAKINWGGRPAVLTVFRDISEELDQRREMVTTAERLQLALDAAQDGVWDWDIPSGLMVYNEVWAAMLGLTLAEIDGSRDTWRNLIHPDDYPRVEDHLTDHLKGSVPNYEIEVRLRHKKGHYIWVLDRGKVVERDQLGQPLRMTGTHRNITPRKEAELALATQNRVAETFLTRETETLYHQILQVIRDFIGAPIGLFASLNPQGELLVRATSGRTHPDLPTMGPEMAFEPGQLPQAFKSVLNDRQTLISNDALILPNHFIPFKSVLGVPICSREIVLGAIFMGNKEGGFKKTDQVFLESLAVYLAPLLHAHLNSEAKEIQLRQVEKMEALGALSGGIAHDFNNILQAIMGFTSLALEDAGQEGNIPRDLDRVLKAARRGQDLVQMIQTFSRREEQKHVALDIQPVVQDAISLLKPTLPATIEIRSHLEAADAQLFGDPGQISQMILHLATNAYHAMESAGGILEINLKLTRDAGIPKEDPHLGGGREMVEFSISDTGVGMSEDIKERIFDPFFTTKEVGQGTGLGMSAVHGIVQAHFGQIQIDSEPGQGTTVRVLLPTLNLRETAEKTSRKFIPPNATTEGRKIAILDDEEDITDIGKAMLERLGHRVSPQSNGLHLLELVENDPQLFDLIITDLTMPQITGLQLAERLQKIRPDLPIILITGISELKDINLHSHPNIKGLIRKPFEVDRLREMACRLLAVEGIDSCPES